MNTMNKNICFGYSKVHCTIKLKFKFIRLRAYSTVIIFTKLLAEIKETSSKKYYVYSY